ncbi:MAG: MBL fold metallo-hydrolase [Acidimicrobiales bacterium]
MDDLRRINRRLFLNDMGRNTLAIAVLGSGVLAACSSDGEITPSAAGSTEDSGTTTTAATTSTADEPTTAGAESADTTDAAQPAAAFRWERVVLGNVSAYVLARGSEIAIVDTGFAGSSTQIETALSTLGAGWGDVNDVVLTHLHNDHVGGLPEILDLSPTATAWAGEADVSRISAPRDIEPLNDGDEVFGLQVIATPGHTPGHISVLDPDAGFLVAGDSMNESGGMVLGPNPSFTPDMDTANASVKRLAERSFETVVFGHGSPIEVDASDAVVALAQTL